MAEKFSNEVCEAVGWYVYRLIDPRNGETFYVGKGKDNRVFDHVKAAQTDINAKLDDEDSSDLKVDRIREIIRSKSEV